MRGHVTLGLVFTLLVGVASAQVEDVAQSGNQRFISELQGEETCLACHSDVYLARANGVKDSSLWLDETLFHESAHADLGCVACHPNIDPAGHQLIREDHPWFTDRVPSVAIAKQACLDCHEKEYEDYHESIHGVNRLEKHELAAAFCTDCHGFHYILPASDERSWTHKSNIPAMCLKCHAERGLKQRFGLTKYVAETFQESFHKKRAELGAAEVPVCSTCHGHHAIFPRDDTRSTVHPGKVAVMCGECHEGAAQGFGEAFTHTRVSTTEMRWFYFVKQAHMWLIVVVIGPLGAIVLCNAGRTLRARRKRNA